MRVLSKWKRISLQNLIWSYNKRRARYMSWYTEPRNSFCLQMSVAKIYFFANIPNNNGKNVLFNDKMPLSCYLSVAYVIKGITNNILITLNIIIARFKITWAKGSLLWNTLPFYLWAKKLVWLKRNYIGVYSLFTLRRWRCQCSKDTIDIIYDNSTIFQYFLAR